jgi:hypothetical protein
MGVGLYLTGVVGASGDPLEHIERFVRQREGDDLLSLQRGETSEGLPALYVHNHPAAETVEFWLEDRRLTVSARTSTVGPGYHADLCEMLRGLGELLPIAWDPPDEEEGTGDETGYFLTGDRAELEQQMLSWLAKVLEVLREKGEEYTGLQLSMPMAPRYHGPPGAWLMTQSGPRSRAWMEAVLADPRAGIDVFPWWEPGKGAATDLGRVRVHLWMDVRWRPPATDEEERLGSDLLRRLARAYRLDPELDYPWSAWQVLIDEVAELEDDDLGEIIRARAGQGAAGPLGYREHEVEELLPGGWKITLPGSFSLEIDEEGTWSAWEDGASIWATAFSLPESTEPVALPLGDELPEDSEPVHIEELEQGEVRYCAFSKTFLDEGQQYWQVQGQILSEARLLLLTVVVPEETQLGWARQVIASVQGE